MKKFFLTFAILVLVALAAHRPEAAASEAAGRVEIFAGEATMERAAGGRQKLETGDPVFAKDIIQTGPGGSAEIILADGSRTQLAADTALEVAVYQYDPGKKIRHALITLTSGKARFFVQDLEEFNDRRFRVQTETAVVASLDTGFIVAFNPELPRDAICRKGLTNVVCLVNSVVVSSLSFQDKPTVLPANMISQVCGANLPSPPRFVTPSELAWIEAGLATGTATADPNLSEPQGKLEN
jgi:ferric-dicitrate binding protein FerR (iron transport regulator)